MLCIVRWNEVYGFLDRCVALAHIARCSYCASAATFATIFFCSPDCCCFVGWFIEISTRTTRVKALTYERAHTTTRTHLGHRVLNSQLYSELNLWIHVSTEYQALRTCAHIVDEKKKK